MDAPSAQQMREGLAQLSHSYELSASQALTLTPTPTPTLTRRAAFMDKKECVVLLLEAGADPRIASNDCEMPVQVLPSYHPSVT